MKFHLINEVMMYAMGREGGDDNDDSHLIYLLACPRLHLQFNG